MFYNNNNNYSNKNNIFDFEDNYSIKLANEANRKKYIRIDLSTENKKNWV